MPRRGRECEHAIWCAAIGKADTSNALLANCVRSTRRRGCAEPAGRTRNERRRRRLREGVEGRTDRHPATVPAGAPQSRYAVKRKAVRVVRSGVGATRQFAMLGQCSSHFVQLKHDPHAPLNHMFACLDSCSC
eukprot:7389897-Prymnesium_polylepis.1